MSVHELGWKTQNAEHKINRNETQPGFVYVFHRNGNIEYVGVTNDLPNRALSSLRERYFRRERKGLQLTVEICANYSTAKVVETYMIERLKPAKNKTTKATHGRCVADLVWSGETVNIGNIEGKTEMEMFNDLVNVYNDAVESEDRHADR